MNKIAGVYKITNKITGDFYVGSSKDIEKRWHEHKSISTQKRQPNSKLYKAMASYGLGNFIFEVFEETDNLKEREQYWIEQLKPTYNDRHAKGQDTERYKETTRRYKKEWYKVNRDYNKEWHKSHRNEQLAKTKAYYSRLCLYEGEILTLSALSKRFFKQGIPHPCKEAKKYLMT